MSLATIALSVFYYFNQSIGRIAKEAQGTIIKSRLSNYELYRYRGDQLTARATGNTAILMDQGRLLCEGGTKLIKISDGIRQEIEAESAEVKFQSEALFGDGAGVVETLVFSGDVEYLRGKTRFHTDWISYTEKTGEAFTDRPVRVDSEGQFIASEGGMTYNLKTESLRMRGGVFGTVRTDAIQSRAGGAAGK